MSLISYLSVLFGGVVAEGLMKPNMFFQSVLKPLGMHGMILYKNDVIISDRIPKLQGGLDSPPCIIGL
jgi:hypothetical protein